ncbi:short chain dehydrogenase reductase [Grosmannia clavigera kw1407]|uniref:Short chain dehydrogenase reductase n=1 Tax=Grosmannia clavigera (strain kw1407 / UAMH 11150) TaxID=655863 RepID=F0XHT3_GROCL|nr:short chain dehydrogenase reductase [Grosmannia clavigera kw1407]EFX02714.1 short chain dehydrogenase reductase [Grosmannia clavigera kw1407]
MSTALLKGTAFITGAASGIGRATAFAFARHGIENLALADVDIGTLQASSKALSEQFPHVQVLELQLDVAQAAAVHAAIATVVDRFGRLDIAVNNAGISGSGRKTHEVDEAEWRRVINVDLDGVWRCQKEELVVMLKQEDLGPRIGRGRIINTSSMYGVVGMFDLAQTAYSTAKHGVIGLTRSDANAYGPMGIRLNCICPGFIRTPLLENVPGDSPIMKDVERSALRRMGQPEEIADAITFLASPMSSFVQGASMVVDGGFTTQ